MLKHYNKHSINSDSLVYRKMPVFPGFAFQVSLYFVTVRNVDEDSLPVM